MQFDPEGGFYLIDKPLEWTSFQVVNKIKYLIKHKVGRKVKVGHAGTLDPLASGLLIVCYGKMTKEIERFQELTKEYTGVFKLGSTTPSFDLETDIDHTFPVEHITLDKIRDVSRQMIGPQMQQPPLFSAKKIDGKRAYEHARKGEVKELRKNPIEIYEFDVKRDKEDEIIFRVSCSKGTYIRTLAHEFGKELDSGAHLKSLRRTAIGDYTVNNAYQIETFEKEFRALAN